MCAVKTEKELGEALKRGDDTIEIEGDLANKIIKIRATGKVAWVIAIAAIGVAFYAIVATAGTGGTAAPVTGISALIAAPAAVVVLGGAVTYTAIAIAVAAGGIGALTSLRDYKEISRSQNKLVLKKK